MLVLGAVGLFSFSGGELQASRTGWRRSAGRICSRQTFSFAIVFFLVVVPSLYTVSRADLQLLITAKEKEAAEAG